MGIPRKEYHGSRSLTLIFISRVKAVSNFAERASFFWIKMLLRSLNLIIALWAAICA